MKHLEKFMQKGSLWNYPVPRPKILYSPPFLYVWEERVLHDETPRAKSTVGVTPWANGLGRTLNNYSACDTLNTTANTMALDNLNIVAGTFSKNGNFTGRTALYKKTFIHGGTMKAKGWDTIDKVQFPFVAISEITQVAKTTKKELVNDDGTIVMEYVPMLGADGQPAFDSRETTLAIFANEQEAITAHLAESSLDKRIKDAVAYAQKNYKLDDASLAKLTANSAF
jgi:hypothetical protein